MWRRGTGIVVQQQRVAVRSAQNGFCFYASAAANFDQLKSELHTTDSYGFVSKMIDQNDIFIGEHVQVDEASVEREFKAMSAHFKNPKAGDVLRKIARMKVIELERVKTASPEVAKQVAAGYKAKEEAAYAAAKQKIKPSTDATQSKKFVQDPIGALIYKNAKRLHDRLNALESAESRAFPNSAQVFSQYILDAIADTSAEEEQPSKDGWKQPPISVLGQEFTTNQEAFDSLLDTGLEADSSLSLSDDPKVKLGSMDAKVSAATGGLVTDSKHEKYKDIAKLITDAENVPDSEAVKAFKEAYKNIAERKKQLKETFQTLVESNNLEKEVEALAAKNVGEHGVFNRAMRNFLGEHQHPTSMQKLQFMKQQRTLLQQQRASQNLAQQYPGVNTASKNLNDSELLNQFDLARDRLYGI
eukprot:TRINITY_DN135_c0_g1_i1.p1 TRINITY_DN135_c0_g1~~TRINITY_DN135_c0_g1_i1.p1  ORF type:complete len:415 (-),score=97.00 TRINITY_DN135_c0_g1_i1:65-1309(-)